MATESQDQQDGSTEDSSGEEQQGQQQQTTDDTSANGSQQQVTKDTVLPDDHPVVKQLKDDKAKLASVRTELAEARSQAAQATKLQAELDASPTAEALATLQTRYDRLEAFAQAVGLGKALDSRTFTRDLFESDTKVEDLVKAWNRDHPTATSTALGSAGSASTGSKQDPNDLLRAAFKGSK